MCSVVRSPKKDRRHRRKGSDAGAACRQQAAGLTEDALQQFFLRRRCNICFGWVFLSLSASSPHSPFPLAGHGRTCAFLVIEIFTCFVLCSALCIEYLIADNIDNNKGEWNGKINSWSRRKCICGPRSSRHSSPLPLPPSAVTAPVPLQSSVEVRTCQ